MNKIENWLRLLAALTGWQKVDRYHCQQGSDGGDGTGVGGGLIRVK